MYTRSAASCDCTNPVRNLTQLQSEEGIAAQVVVGVPGVPLGVQTDPAQDDVVKDPPLTVVLLTIVAIGLADLLEA